MSVCKNTFSRLTDKCRFDPVLQKWTYYAEVPCGKCTPCKIEIAKEWALRCCLELPYWNNAIFTTLTYRDSDLPSDYSLHKEHLEKFFNDVRNDLRGENKIKFLASGEYGSKNFRPHYHAIIFGVGLSNNKRIIGAKDVTYDSVNRILEKNWTKGNVFNGCVTYNSCRYTASYVFKKYYDSLRDEVYLQNGLQVPFQKVSNGLGKSWYQEYGKVTLKRGYIMFNGVKHTIPRYFLKLYEKEGFKADIEQIQKNHALDNFASWYDSYISRLSLELAESPDVINKMVCSDFESRLQLGEDFKIRTLIQNGQKADHAEKANKLFFGV